MACFVCLVLKHIFDKEIKKSILSHHFYICIRLIRSPRIRRSIFSQQFRPIDSLSKLLAPPDTFTPSLSV